MIHILYRGTSHISGKAHGRPEGFSYDKCLNNILSTIENNLNVAFHLLWDGKNPPQHPRMDKVIEFEGGSDQNSFFYAWEYAKSLTMDEKELVYFLENDYLHVDDWHEKLVDLFSAYTVDGYVSLYDHLDKYTDPAYVDLASKIYITKSSHWRTIPSTCGSFIISKKILDEDYDIHTSFYGDHDKFLWLGQNRNRLILSAIPSLSTHCTDKFMAPTIDWNKINNK
jgi:hypothetical protein